MSEDASLTSVLFVVLSILRGSGGDSLLFQVKLFIMVFLMVLDLGLNSSVEHEAYGTQNADENDTVLALILG